MADQIKKWQDFVVSPTDDRFIPWFYMGRYCQHCLLLENQAEEILGSEVHWWLTGPECIGRWRLVEFNTYAGPRTARHQTVLLFEYQQDYDAFVRNFGAIFTSKKAAWYEKKYRELKADLKQKITDGRYDFSNLGERYRRSAARDYINSDKRIKKYRNKWSSLKKRAKKMCSN